MEKIPMEWVDKIFELMGTYFNEKWSRQIPDLTRLAIMRKLWQSGLQGLTREQIKEGLRISRDLARNDQNPPHVLDFFHYAKGIRKPHFIVKGKSIPKNYALAKDTMDTINMLLKGNNPNRNQDGQVKTQ